MAESKDNTIIIYNYYFFLQKKSIDSIFKNQPFKPMNDNYSIKSSLIIKRPCPINQFILKDGENNLDTKKKKDIKDSQLKEINYNENDDSTPSKNADIIIELPKEKSIIFKTNNKKKVGRKPTSLIIRREHTKFSHDNILRKIKVKVFNKIIKYINSIIKKYNKEHNIGMLLPIVGKIHQNNGIDFNKKLLNSKLKDIFLKYEINGKFTLFKKSYNEDIIRTIYEKNIEELINILEMTFLDIFIIFRNDKELNKFEGLEKIDITVKEIKKKENDIDYIRKFIDVVNNFENYYFNKDGRKKKFFQFRIF